MHVYQNYRTNTGDTTPTVIASTASPFKFCGSVLPALGEQTDADEFSMLDKLSRLTSLPIPQRLAELRDKEERFTDVVDPSDMIDVVNRLL